MKMRLFLVLVCVTGTTTMAATYENTCSAHVEESCLTLASGTDWDGERSCSALYAGYASHSSQMEQLIKYHLEDSFKFLLMGSHFDRDDVNRHGFHKLLYGFSDRLWEDAKKMIRYTLKRGGSFSDVSAFTMKSVRPVNFESEVQALGVSLDIWKQHANEAVKLTKKAMHRVHSNANGDDPFDPSIIHFLQEEIIEDYTDIIRDTAGQLNVLAKMATTEKTKGLGLHLFDKSLLD